MRATLTAVFCCAAALTLAGCGDAPTAATGPTSATKVGGIPLAFSQSLQPKTDLQVVLREVGGLAARGHIDFRQPQDDALTILLNVQVHELAPNTDYWLQRATDAANVIDGQCVSSGWLTLGYGAGSQVPIHTDADGYGTAALFRTLPAVLEGSAFDIHFRIVDNPAADGTTAAVLQSGCYQFIATR